VGVPASCCVVTVGGVLSVLPGGPAGRWWLGLVSAGRGVQCRWGVRRDGSRRVAGVAGMGHLWPVLDSAVLLGGRGRRCCWLPGVFHGSPLDGLFTDGFVPAGLGIVVWVSGLRHGGFGGGSATVVGPWWCREIVSYSGDAGARGFVGGCRSLVWCWCVVLLWGASGRSRRGG